MSTRHCVFRKSDNQKGMFALMTKSKRTCDPRTHARRTQYPSNAVGSLPLVEIAPDLNEPTCSSSMTLAASHRVPTCAYHFVSRDVI